MSRLDDKYTRERGTVYLTGIQALVRLPMDQMRRDRRAGLNTAAFISGYEGSPLGGYDLALARVRALLDEHRIRFVPGINEDLAATAVMGSQIHHVLGESKYDGVLGIWYGKGPGVDRSGDILRHANLAGTGRHCAALVLGGDDHMSKSSTIPHQSDLSFYNFGIPTFYPGNTQEILDYGALAIALSRHSGAWVAMKMVTNVCDGGGTVEVSPERPHITVPEGYEKHFDPRLVIPFTLRLEGEMVYRRMEAAREFARANGVNSWFGAGEGARLGIATAGKPYYDVMQALGDLGIRREDLDALGIRIAKFGMTFPLEPRFAAEFARGLGTILVVEEKRSFLELQLREALYNLPERPVIIGKQDESGEVLLPAAAELDPEPLARVLGKLTGARRGTAGTHCRDRSARETRSGAALPHLLSGLPAQSLHAAARRTGGGRRHRLPRHVGTAGAPQPRLRVSHPHGWRGRAVDGDGSLRRAAAHLSEHRRRHVFPLGIAGGAGGCGGGRQHHLQDPVQRRGGNDRRAECSGRIAGSGPHPQARGGRRPAHRGDDGRSGEVPRGGVGRQRGTATPRRFAGGAPRTRADPGRDRDRLRSAVRGREAPAAVSREARRTRDAPGHQ